MRSPAAAAAASARAPLPRGESASRPPQRSAAAPFAACSRDASSRATRAGRQRQKQAGLSVWRPFAPVLGCARAEHAGGLGERLADAAPEERGLYKGNQEGGKRSGITPPARDAVAESGGGALREEKRRSGAPADRGFAAALRRLSSSFATATGSIASFAISSSMRPAATAWRSHSVQMKAQPVTLGRVILSCRGRVQGRKISKGGAPRSSRRQRQR